MARVHLKLQGSLEIARSESEFSYKAVKSNQLIINKDNKIINSDNISEGNKVIDNFNREYKHRQGLLQENKGSLEIARVHLKLHGFT